MPSRTTGVLAPRRMKPAGGVRRYCQAHFPSAASTAKSVADWEATSTRPSASTGTVTSSSPQS